MGLNAILTIGGDGKVIMNKLTQKSFFIQGQVNSWVGLEAVEMHTR